VVGEHRAGNEAEEAHMDGAHHLARQAARELGDEEEREREGAERHRAIDDAAPLDAA
jgi:hypothetical protein